MDYPEVALFRQKLCQQQLHEIPFAVAKAFSGFCTAVQAGQSVAVAVGSRGIDRLDQVVRQVVKVLKSWDLNPFIIPAMGSHGGGCPEGQLTILAKLGIRAATMETPIIPDPEPQCIGKIGTVKVMMPAKVLSADHLVVINRIKPHTKFNAPIESGLCKMLTIGLGQASGAGLYHQAAVEQQGFGIIEKAAGLVLKKCNLLAGLALLENGNGKLMQIKGLGPDELIEQEKKLLPTAYHHLGKIPFEQVDILVIDYLGKNISGIGMDSNITGRHRDISGDFYTRPYIKRIFVRDLTLESDGNANGIGLADVTTTRLKNAINFKKTYFNAICAFSPEKAAIPMHFKTDKECLDACLRTIGIAGDAVRIVRIKSTADLGLMQLSRALQPQISDEQKLTQISAWQSLGFNPAGNLNDIHF